MSHRDTKGAIIPTARWTRGERAFSEALINRVLTDVGDTAVERQFRMCVTACRHRATTQAERAALPEWFRCSLPRDIAGAPVAVLWSRGIPAEYDATRPCMNPVRRALSGGLFIPDPCEQCYACRANEQARTLVVNFRRANPDRYLIETK